MSETEVNPYQSPEARIQDRRLHAADHPPLASLRARLGGAAVDGVLGILTSIPLLIAVVRWVIADSSEARLTALSQGEIMDALIADYPGHVLLWVALILVLATVNLVFVIQSSQSIGKRVVGTQIATLDGQRAGALRIVGLRVIVSQILYNIPFVGWLISLVGILMIFGSQRRCLHDHIAGTIVVVHRPAR